MTSPSRSTLLGTPISKVGPRGGRWWRYPGGTWHSGVAPASSRQKQAALESAKVAPTKRLTIDVRQAFREANASEDDPRGFIARKVYALLPAGLKKRWEASPDLRYAAEESLRIQVTRLLESMQAGGRLQDAKKSGSLVFSFVEPRVVLNNSRGDLRYGSDKLAKIVRSGGDLTPVNLGSDGKSVHALDGHHRLRGYLLAGKRAPAWTSKTHAVEKEGAPLIHVSLPDE